MGALYLQPMLPALGWGTLAASSLIIGALLAFMRKWPDRQQALCSPSAPAR